jgi:hypothetical protein
VNFLRLLPIFISFLLLAAHFMRAGQDYIMLPVVILPLLLFVRKPWIPRVFQLVLLLGAIEWLRTLFVFAQMRITFGEPWLRLAVILGAVALFTALSGMVFRARSLRERYRVGDITD